MHPPGNLIPSRCRIVPRDFPACASGPDNRQTIAASSKPASRMPAEQLSPREVSVIRPIARRQSFSMEQRHPGEVPVFPAGIASDPCLQTIPSFRLIPTPATNLSEDTPVTWRRWQPPDVLIVHPTEQNLCKPCSCGQRLLADWRTCRPDQICLFLPS